MATIKITCSCGAVLETEGSSIHCGIEAERFLKEHEKCRIVSQPAVEADTSHR